MIRRAEPRDLPEVTALLKETIASGMRDANLYGLGKVNWRAVEHYIAMGLPVRDRYAVWLGNKAILIAEVVPCWYNPTYRYVEEKLWFAAEPGDGMGLLRCLVEWAEDCCATHVSVMDRRPGNEKKMALVMARHGFEPQGFQWVRVLV